MFKNEFQGGAFLEVLSIQGKDLSSKCKVLGTSINGGSKEFDKSIKSYVLLLEGESTTTKIVIPKDAKQNLCIIQPFLVIQLLVAAGTSFSLEVTVSDSLNQKRRILLSSSYKDISVTSFHVKIPLKTMRRGTWLNFCLDLKSVIEECFKGHSFKTIDSIIICANCKLRKVFTLKSRPKDDFDDADEIACEDPTLYEEIPRCLQFPSVSCATQVLNMTTLKAAGIKFRVGSGISSSSSNGIDNIKADKTHKTHIAFGSRFAPPKQSSKFGTSVSSLDRQTSNASLISNNSPNFNFSQTDLNSSMASIPQVEGQRPVLQPRPPKPASGKVLPRPYPRIRSAERLVSHARSENNASSDGNAVQMLDDDTNGLLENEKKSMQSKFDQNNNTESKDNDSKNTSEKTVAMEMGSQEDEEEYFRKRNDSESQEESMRSKEGSFSSTYGSEPFFLYSSKPHSVLTVSKQRQSSESTLKETNQAETIEDEDTSKNEVILDINVMASFESDFRRESSDSEVDDPLSKIHRLNGTRRNTPSPSFHEKSEDNAKIKSSLLKEISPPSNYDHLKYQSVQSDSMSWIYDSDPGQSIHYKEEDHVLKSKPYPYRIRNDGRKRQIRVIDGLSEANEVGSDSEDILSDTSDETSYSTWKEPPPHIRNYRYQDEMHGVGMTLDLSATLPMTPYIEESPKSEQVIDNSDSGISLQGFERVQERKPCEEGPETELDLLYDPVLNCYYDPTSHKYYELA